MDKRLISNQEAAELILQQSLEYAVVKNPDHVFPAYEYLPLAPKITTLRDDISAIIMDMKGTSININKLSLVSLEKMIRRISGRITKESWAGLDEIIDLPNIFGMHPKKQVEFLISRYHNFINQEYLKESYFYSILWTLILDYDKQQQNIVKEHLTRFGCKDLLTDAKFLEYVDKNKFDRNNANAITNYIILKYGKCLSIRTFNDTITIALDILYQLIHESLALINNKDGKLFPEIIPGNEIQNLIEPAPGLGALLALTKGWLGEDIEYIFNDLLEQLKDKSLFPYKLVDIDVTKNKLVTIANNFKRNPAKIAIVTSSIPFEADILLHHTFSVLLEQLDEWHIPSEKKGLLKEKFSNYRNVFDTIITSGDASEVRLKPHKDMYSLALSRLGIPLDKLFKVLAFEDSENGIVGIRAAGIGLSVAVPVNKIINKDFPAAAFSLNGGLLEALLSYNLFLK